MSTLDGRLVVVTGAGGALGTGIVSAFVGEGAEVLAVDRRITSSPGATPIASDLTDARAVRALFDEIDAPWAVIHTVGGFAPKSRLRDFDITEFQTQITVNLTTTALVVANALRRMEPIGAGRIVATASRAATEISSNGFAYSVSKAGVVHLVAMAAQECEGTEIAVNCVSPSIIDTPANRAAIPDADYTRWPKVDDIARAYVYLADPATSLVHGSVLQV